MASSGSMILVTPSWLPSTPNCCQVEGRNCIGPIAPALEGPMFSPWFDSATNSSENVPVLGEPIPLRRRIVDLDVSLIWDLLDGLSYDLFPDDIEFTIRTQPSPTVTAHQR